MLLAASKDAALGDIINSAALVVPESSGIFWASQQLGTPLKAFVPGIDLFLSLCDLARDTGRTVFLLGAKPGIAEQAAGKLWAMFPGLRIVGTHHGYFASLSDEQGAIDRIKATKPDFLFVAMNVPRQEKWIRLHLNELQASVIMGIGGSFDVISGGLKRAPQWMRDLGLEWLFRTAQQPWRLKRIIHLPVFAWKILRS
jgi:N-acetylglucosaminyldiphosphoundecaprenol N-acetyl-beta-D-mannosaminyltransferase